MPSMATPIRIQARVTRMPVARRTSGGTVVAGQQLKY
uniref:Dfr2 n=1 Tax=Escherichia coli TaxID=562 RepID=A0A0R7I4J1_ECOLX|nr:Dfr2 [Escherichia coli]